MRRREEDRNYKQGPGKGGKKKKAVGKSPTQINLRPNPIPADPLRLPFCIPEIQFLNLLGHVAHHLRGVHASSMLLHLCRQPGQRLVDGPLREELATGVVALPLSRGVRDRAQEL